MVCDSPFDITKISMLKAGIKEITIEGAEKLPSHVTPRYLMLFRLSRPSTRSCRRSELTGLLNVREVILRPCCMGIALLGLPMVRCRKDGNKLAINCVSQARSRKRGSLQFDAPS